MTCDCGDKYAGSATREEFLTSRRATVFFRRILILGVSNILRLSVVKI
jgi:hypothetical protein